MSRCLSIPLKHPVIFNGHKSYVVSVEKQETHVLPLFLAGTATYKTFYDAVHLIEGNLRNILRALERLKEREHIGRQSAEDQKLSDEQHLEFPNMLL